MSHSEIQGKLACPLKEVHKASAESCLGLIFPGTSSVCIGMGGMGGMKKKPRIGSDFYQSHTTLYDVLTALCVEPETAQN